MPRAPVTSDVYNAVAEPRRRQIIDLLARRRRMAVGAIVVALGLPQPVVSKHLAVLRATGVVSATQEGQHRVYALNAEPLRQIFDWIKAFEHHWDHQLNRVRARAEQRAATLASKTTKKGTP